MTQERINEAIKAWQKISDACAVSTDIDWILNSSKDAQNFYCFDIERAEHCEVYWLNVDEIICAEVFRNKGDKEWRVSPHIEIICPETNDWDGINYNVCAINNHVSSNSNDRRNYRHSVQAMPDKARGRGGKGKTA